MSNILNLDKILCIFFGENIFTNLNNRQYKILIGCSKGRLRSPAVWLYARFLGIDAKILKYGVKHYAN